MSSTDPTPGPADLVIRAGEEGDVDALAAVHLESRGAAGGAMPPAVHGADDLRRHLRGRLREGDEVWVAERSGGVVGYARLVRDWLDDLYVAPAHTGQGVGSALLDLVKALRPGGFALWVFESNGPARGFYRRHGLVELDHTDGSGNEERAPDLRMAWPGADPVGFLRAQMDEVDDELALLLSRRTALTAAIQRHKPVPGHAGRDPDREAEIAERLARRAPAIGPDGWRRIMHEIITAGLDAASSASGDQLEADPVGEDQLGS